MNPIDDPDVIEQAGLRHESEAWHEIGGSVSVFLIIALPMNSFHDIRKRVQFRQPI